MQIRLHPGQHLGCSHQHGHVGIVAAGVHHADLATVVLGASGGLERNIDLLGHRQRIHVGPKGHDGTRLAAAEHGNDAGVGHVRANLQAEAAQVVGDDLGRPRLAIPQFGVLVEVATPGDDLGHHLRCGAVNLLVEGDARLALRAGGRRKSKQREQCRRSSRGHSHHANL